MDIYALERGFGDSCSVLVAPKEKALNYLKGERAARQKIKEETTFQCELLTVLNPGDSDVPLQPDFQLQNEPRSIFLTSMLLSSL